jgi:hypothetical protein
MEDDNSAPLSVRGGFSRAASALALTYNLFTGPVKSANDKVKKKVQYGRR